MQHPPTDKILKQMSKVRRGADGKTLNPIERYAADKQAIFERAQKAQPDWFASFPVVNPHKIIEESKRSPMAAASLCKLACSMLAKMEERNVREYVAASYCIACDMKLNERAIVSLAREVQDGRYKNGVPTELVRENILHYLFLFVFYQSGIRTRDRATQYAQGLKEYFFERRPPEVVRQIILEHGPDRLRRVAQRKTNLIEGAQEWAKQSKNPAAPSFDEVLATLLAEEAKAATTGEADETFDHGSRALPPDGSDDQESDADWIANAKLEEDEEAEESDGEEAERGETTTAVGNTENDGNDEDDDLPHEFDEFFTTAARLTGQIYFGLNDEAMTPAKRKALNALVLQLVAKMIFFKRSVTQRTRETAL